MYENIDKNLYTPMMRQYLDIKEQHTDSLVFFRLGDFYEMFFNDALVASKELEIALTARDAGHTERVPMCGVPHHAVDNYIKVLIEKGFKVAIVEQVEDPKDAKGIVKRDVIRVITPGTVMESSVIDSKNNNYLMALEITRSNYYISYSDLSTGENFVTKIDKDIDLLISEILSIKCKEIIINEKDLTKDLELIKNNYQITISYEEETNIPSYMKSLIKELFDELEIKVFGRLLNYIIKTQKRELIHMQEVKVYESKDYLRIDNYSRRNLELTETLRNNTRQGSLLWLLDKCETAMGSRYLKQTINRPLVNKQELEDRYEFVTSLIKNFIVKEDLKLALRDVYDLERIVGKISFGTVNAKDLNQLKRSIKSFPIIRKKLDELNTKYATTLETKINLLNDLYDLLDKALIEDAPLSIKEGGLIKPGYNEQLDKLKNASVNGKEWIAKLEQDERKKTNIKSLKVGYNRIFGYYIEVTKSNLHLVKDEFGYTRKQTLANSERYITEELKEQESIILNAEEKAINLEYDLFINIREESKKYIRQLQANAKIIALVDMLMSFSIIAEENRYIKPSLNEEYLIDIIDGRHPVVEKVLVDSQYIENSIYMDDSITTLLITGPNMSGKSTYMRQLALISIMAQIGSFVPAKSANIMIFDQIFTRIGASDDLVGGQSTFMVEMVEVNNALSNATDKSLVLFDEIGRGTATYDGMALAQAIIEYVYKQINAKTLFSTHYHELTHLEEKLDKLKNIHVIANDEKGKIVFLHKVKEGPTDKSYGINVASLANLPKGLIKRAQDILDSLEDSSVVVDKLVDINLFNFDEYKEEENYNNVTDNELDVLNKLFNIDIDNLSPKQALDILYEIKSLLK